MKIGFCGAASTGKTTMAEMLAEMIPEDYKPSIVRGVMERWGLNEKTSLALSLEDRLKLQIDIFEAKSEQDAQIEHGIFDRTLIDQLTYMTIRCHEILNDSLYAEFRMRAEESLRMYDIIFYFPVHPKIPYADDGFRTNGVAYREMQDILMLGHLNRSRVSYRVAPYDIAEERAKLMYTLIEAHRNGKSKKVS